MTSVHALQVDGPPEGPSEDLSGFHPGLRTQNVGLLVWTSIVFNTVILGWSAFDWLLAPQHWQHFLILRLLCVGINTALVLALHKSGLRRFSNEAFLLWVFVTAAFITPMLSQVGNAFLAYSLGYALVLLSAGVLPMWHPRWAFSSVALALLFTMLAFAKYPPTASKRDLITGCFFVLTIAAGSPLIAWTKYSLARRTWLTLKELQDERTVSMRLRDMDRMKDEFLANISHELRTPLNGIIGLSDSMLEDASGSASQEQRRNLRMISASGRRLANLVNDILDFARLRNHELALSPCAVEMHAAVDVVFALLRTLAKSKSLELRNSVPPNLPLAWVDEGRLQQVLVNLVGNALKFTEHGFVEVEASLVRSHLQVTVRDTGIGIAADQQALIFEPFIQADASVSRNYGGTGLGLAITRKLIDAMGGSISVRSELGYGAEFLFTLPVSDRPALPDPSISDRVSRLASDTPYPDDAETPPQPVTSGEDAAIRVLAIDDEPVNLQVVTNHLTAKGYHVLKAQSGDEGLALLEGRYAPDIILLDVMMPRMSGYEVLDRVRRQRSASQLPVILLTAKNQVSDLVAGFEAGANDYLTKPISRGELLARIKTHLHLSKLFNSYGRFVPYDFIQHLDRESILDVKLGDQVQKEMGVLFSDIRSFTELSEAMSPRENFNFLNSLLKRVAPVIAENNGFIDQYIGDAVMALFPGAADDAVSAAAALRKAVRLYNEHRAMSGYRPIQLGTGIHVGPLILGTIGYEDRMQTTVIADTVNQASRLEGLTKYFKLEVVVSEDTIKRLRDPDRFHTRWLGHMRVKGKSQAISIFELLDGATPEELERKLHTKPYFAEGVRALTDGDLAAAVKSFSTVRSMDMDDSAALRLLERAEHLLTHPEARTREDELVERRL